MQNFALIVRPLHDLTKQQNKFTWTSDCQDAFDTLKRNLTGYHLLTRFYLATDASNHGIGCVLSQQNDKGQSKPIAFAGRAFTKAEKTHYNTTEQELLATVWSLHHFKVYLAGGKEFDLFSDHCCCDESSVNCGRVG